jgi:hypothetical protein
MKQELNKNISTFTKSSKLIIVIVSFIQLLFTLLAIDRLKGEFGYIVVPVFVIATLFLLIIFFKIAYKWLKVLMVICLLLASVRLVINYEVFSKRLIEKTLNKIRGVSEITVIVGPGISLFDSDFLIDLEANLSEKQGVDSLFIYGIDELNHGVIVFEAKDNICRHLGVSVTDVTRYVDSLLRSEQDIRMNDFHMIKYEKYPLVALGDFMYKNEKYKPEIFKNAEECNVHIDEFEIKYVIYCSSETESRLRSDIESYFSLLAKESPFDRCLKIE